MEKTVSKGRGAEQVGQEVNDTDLMMRLQKGYGLLVEQIHQVIVGQDEVIESVLCSMLAGGHCLVQGVPGLAKTLLVHSIAQSLAMSFNRIQFTPDLMPSDITGTDIIQEDPDSMKRSYEFIKGPIFANVILADEINRAPAKVQSALLEAMQEHQVTIGHESFPLPEPFMVLATQNPIEQEGTYPLPEAQVDRFMLKLKITYPSKQEERVILDRMGQTNQKFDIEKVVSPAEIMAVRQIVDEIYIDDGIKDYIVNIVDATRHPEVYRLDLKNLIAYGASPRATIYLTVASKAYAFTQGRGYVTPQDVKSIGMDVLRHRVIVSYEAEAEEKTSEDIIKHIFDNIEVP